MKLGDFKFFSGSFFKTIFYVSFHYESFQIYHITPENWPKLTTILYLAPFKPGIFVFHLYSFIFFVNKLFCRHHRDVDHVFFVGTLIQWRKLEGDERLFYSNTA